MPNNFPGLELREGVFDNVPHVIIGKQNSQPQAPPMRPPNYPQRVSYPQQNYPKPPEDLVDKLKKWALIFFTILILGAAGYMVVQTILGRFF